MRLIITVLVILVSVVLLFLNISQEQSMVTLHKGNLSMKAIPIKVGHYQDSFCGMVIDELEYSSQVVAKDGRTWFFHDHADFVLWLKDKKFDNPKIWVYARDKRDYIDGKKAWYSYNEITPMESGFGAYEQKQDGFIDYEEMRLRTLRGETMADPKIRQRILGE